MTEELQTTWQVNDDQPPCEPEHVCAPSALIPAWWSGFLFHVLNPRQISMYMYLTMLADERSECSPTIDQIREDLGLYSTSMVFEALAALDDLGFITRIRAAFPGIRARRNLYRRPSCESTLYRLLERGRIDGHLRSTNPTRAPASAESQALIEEGLAILLGEAYAKYQRTPEEEKRAVLMELLASGAGSAVLD
ncbi:MAG TPA: hypothetical protein VMD07_10440 [Candidatus Acidoferrales bacterium]|nr:hypothetical protein [Candidatus Acidoferrales bacterium]